ncbi:MAG: ABC transporter substrate-binding protein, partial [Acidimicrobiaceae bacterium]|nr:ABC transporter substrate-binding protein [Acidimicrobiaceae bacterium]
MSEEREPLPDLSRLPEFSRRRILQLLGAGGAALAAAPIISACSSSSKSGSSPTTAASSSGSSATSGASTPNTSGAGSVADIAKYIGPIDAAHAQKGVAYPVGCVLALTGAGNFYGKIMSRGVNLAVKHIAALGGPNFQVSFKDHKSGDATAGVQAATQLGDAKVPVMLASYADDLGAMIPLSSQFKILSLDGGGGTALAFNDKPYFWGMRANTPVDPFPGVMMYIKQQMPSVKKVTFLPWNLGSAVNAVIVGDWKKQLRNAGLTPGPVVYVTDGQTDFSNTLQQLKNDPGDLVMLSNYGLDPGYFIKQYVTSGIDKPLIGFEFTPDAAHVAGSAYNKYTYAFDYFDTTTPPNPWSKIFLSEWEKTYGSVNSSDFDFYAANYYEDMFAVWDLIRRVSASGGDIHSGTDLQKALMANPTFKSVYGVSSTTAGTLTLDLTTHAPTARPM